MVQEFFNRAEQFVYVLWVNTVLTLDFDFEWQFKFNIGPNLHTLLIFIMVWNLVFHVNEKS